MLRIRRSPYPPAGPHGPSEAGLTLSPPLIPLSRFDHETDEFGRDPAVRSMRRVFASMETVQPKTFQAARFLCLTGAPRVAEQALQLFEQRGPGRQTRPGQD